VVVTLASLYPVVAEPGIWTSLRSRVSPDCEIEPAASRGDTLAAEAQVHTDTSETAVALEFGSGNDWFLGAWETMCSPDDMPMPTIWVQSVDVQSREVDSATIQTRLHVTAVSAAPAPATQPAVVRVWPHVPGVEVTVSGLPVELAPEQPAEIDVEWQLTDCDEIGQLDRAELALHVTADVADSAARAQNVPVPATILVELGRLTADIC
jgi:hypothetical protein